MGGAVSGRWGKTELPPEAGVAAYARGERGRLTAARIYDDTDPRSAWLLSFSSQRWLGSLCRACPSHAKILLAPGEKGCMKKL